VDLPLLPTVDILRYHIMCICLEIYKIRSFFPYKKLIYKARKLKNVTCSFPELLPIM
jgi:hypothetical protein